MSEVEKLRKELDEIAKQREELKRQLLILGIKKMVAHCRLMRTPEARKAYKEAYRKVRHGE